MVVALLLAGGVALAANIQCQGGACVGTEQNDRITGSRDDDSTEALGGRNDLSGNGGDDCLDLGGDALENERVSRGDGDDLLFPGDLDGDDVFCGAGHDTVIADAENRVAADCEDVIRPSPSRRLAPRPNRR
jgi:hypothetical protein